MRADSRPVKALAYSTHIAQAIVGAPRRGAVHSAFSAAANILFPGDYVTQTSGNHACEETASSSDARHQHDFVLSLNAASSIEMPNGLHLSAPAGTFPFSALAVGMPIILGANRLHIEAIECSLDLSSCEQWDSFIEHPADVDGELVLRNSKRVEVLIANWRESFGANEAPGLLFSPDLEKVETDTLALAAYLCGRGPGLTPAGDDMLVGWMAAGWLLYGPHPALLDVCRQIVAIARRQTHLLSRCWLSYAAQGCVAMPIKVLLQALTRLDDGGLEIAVGRVLEMGATSGYDGIRGILWGCGQYFSASHLCG